MLGAPPYRARAAEEAPVRPLAAAAYFSNGTRSAGSAPSDVTSPTTHSYTVREASRSECTVSLIERMPLLVMQR